MINSLSWRSNSFLAMLMVTSAIALCSLRAASSTSTASTDDPYLWLEDVTGERALHWVRQQNAVSTNELQARPEFEPMRQRFLSIMDSKDRIPRITKEGKFFYNFWRDGKNVRGLWRRTTLTEYRKSNPARETVLDLDDLAAKEKENWVWKYVNVIEQKHDRCLISLSRGGADAVVVREFDLKRKEFVTNGFQLPEAKSRVDWRNRHALYVGTDFGSGSMTKSGYPRTLREWKRGTPLANAVQVFEGSEEDVSVTGVSIHDHGRTYDFVDRRLTFFTDETFVRRADKWVRLDKPADADVQTFRDHLLLSLRSDWTAAGKTYASGSLLAANFDDYLKGDRKFAVLFTPAERKSLEDISATRDYLILTELDNVRSRPYLLNKVGGEWKRTPVDDP